MVTVFLPSCRVICRFSSSKAAIQLKTCLSRDWSGRRRHLGWLIAAGCVSQPYKRSRRDARAPATKPRTVHGATCYHQIGGVDTQARSRLSWQHVFFHGSRRSSSWASFSDCFQWSRATSSDNYRAQGDMPRSGGSAPATYRSNSLGSAARSVECLRPRRDFDISHDSRSPRACTRPSDVMGKRLQEWRSVGLASTMTSAPGSLM